MFPGLRQATRPLSQRRGFVHACLSRSPRAMNASSETVSRGACMCDVRYTAQIGYPLDSLGIEGAGVRNYLSLTGGCNILISGWVAPYFSPGNARVIH